LGQCKFGTVYKNYAATHYCPKLQGVAITPLVTPSQEFYLAHNKQVIHEDLKELRLLIDVF
jgi:hypothetical protein